MLPILITDGDSENQVTDLETERNSEMTDIIVTKSAKASYLVTVTIGGHEITMQLDTGAAVSIILEPTYKAYFTEFPLTETKPFKSYSGDQLQLLKQICVPVKYDTQTVTYLTSSSGKRHLY